MSDPVASLVASGESSTATTTVTFSAQTAGTVLVLATAADDYATGTPSGWTACIAEQQTFHGLNVWRKVSTGSETSVAYTIGSATKSAYCLIVVTDCDTSDLVDVAVGAYDQSSGNTYTGPAASTTSGRRISLAVIGGSLSSATIPSISAWTDGYTSVGAGSTSATPGLIAAVAALVLDGGSSTSTTANYGAASPQARSGATVVLRASSGAASHTATPAAAAWVGLTAIGAGLAVDPVPLDLTPVGTPTWTAPASGTAVAPTYPSGLAEGDLVEALVVVKPNTATVTTPSGWTATGSQAVGGGTQGAGTGAVKVWRYTRTVPAGGLTGTESFSVTGGSSLVGTIRGWRPETATGITWDVDAQTFYSRTTASTTFGDTGAADLGLAAKDVLGYVSASADDQSSTHTISALAATGATLAARVVSPSGTITNSQGNDISAAAAYAIVESGASTAAPSATVTGSSSETGGGVFWRLRATGYPGSTHAATPAAAAWVGLPATGTGSGTGSDSHTGIAAALLVVGLTASSLTGLSATARPAALALSGIALVVTNVLVIDGTGPAALAIAALTAQASYGLTATATPAALALGTQSANSSTAAPTTATATPAATAWVGVPATSTRGATVTATPAATAWTAPRATATSGTITTATAAALAWVGLPAASTAQSSSAALATPAGISIAAPKALATSGTITNAIPAPAALVGLPATGASSVTAQARPAATGWVGSRAASSAGVAGVATPAVTAWTGVPAQASTANAHAATPAAIAWVGLSATGATSEAFIAVRVTLTGTPWAPTLTGTARTAQLTGAAYTPTLTGAPS